MAIVYGTQSCACEWRYSAALQETFVWTSFERAITTLQTSAAPNY